MAKMTVNQNSLNDIILKTTLAKNNYINKEYVFALDLFNEAYTLATEMGAGKELLSSAIARNKAKIYICLSDYEQAKTNIMMAIKHLNPAIIENHKFFQQYINSTDPVFLQGKDTIYKLPNAEAHLEEYKKILCLEAYMSFIKNDFKSALNLLEEAKQIDNVYNKKTDYISELANFIYIEQFVYELDHGKERDAKETLKNIDFSKYRGDLDQCNSNDDKFSFLKGTLLPEIISKFISNYNEFASKHNDMPNSLPNEPFVTLKHYLNNNITHNDIVIYQTGDVRDLDNHEA